MGPMLQNETHMNKSRYEECKKRIVMKYDR
jgi:hypothetical protein